MLFNWSTKHIWRKSILLLKRKPALRNLLILQGDIRSLGSFGLTDDSSLRFWNFTRKNPNEMIFIVFLSYIETWQARDVQMQVQVYLEFLIARTLSLKLEFKVFCLFVCYFPEIQVGVLSQ